MNGSILEVHLDYIQRPPVRTCEIIGEEGRIEWDYFKNEVRLFLNKDESLTTYREKKFERNKMFEDELEHFLKCVKNREREKVTFDEVKNIMKTIEAIKKSSKERRSIRIDGGN